MTPEFKEAPLYSCKDDLVRHTDWAAAVQEVLEDDWEKDETTTEQCERIGAITVTAFKPGTISTSWLDAQVELLMERFKEDFNEEYGCEDYEADPWPKDNGDWIKKVVTANLTKSLRNAETYTVIEVGTHTFSVEECIEMMK